MADAASVSAAAPQETYSITLPLRDYRPVHFKLEVDGKTAVVTLNRPERKNPLTFHSYAELRDMFRALQFEEEVKTVVVTGAGGNFCPAATSSRSSSLCCRATCPASCSSPA